MSTVRKEPVQRLIRATGGVVYRLNGSGQLEILLIKKQHGFWSLPKGKIKAGEGAVAALRREIAEETGITGTVEELVAVARYTVVRRERQRPKEVAYYLFRATGGALCPSPSEQIIRARWFSVLRALRRLKRPRLRAIVRAAQTLLGERLGAEDESGWTPADEDPASASPRRWPPQLQSL